MIKNDYKEIALKAINKLYREDPWVRELYQACGVKIEDVSNILDEIDLNRYFDTASEKAVEEYERELNIIPKGSLEGRRATIQAKWKTGGIINLQKLQAIVSSYRNGVIRLSFEHGKIHVMFNSPIGRPPDIDLITEMLENVKPAHLPIFYTFSYITWGLHHNKPRTWGDLHKDTWYYALQERG